MWTYIRTQTSDHLPFVGQVPGYSNEYVNTGYDDNPFGLGFLASKSLAEKLLGKKVESNQFEIFNPNRINRGE